MPFIITWYNVLLLRHKFRLKWQILLQPSLFQLTCSGVRTSVTSRLVNLHMDGVFTIMSQGMFWKLISKLFACLLIAVPLNRLHSKPTLLCLICLAFLMFFHITKIYILTPKIHGGTALLTTIHASLICHITAFYEHKPSQISRTIYIFDIFFSRIKLADINNPT